MRPTTPKLFPLPNVYCNSDPDNPDWQYVPMIEFPEDRTQEPLPEADPVAAAEVWNSYAASMLSRMNDPTAP